MTYRLTPTADWGTPEERAGFRRAYEELATIINLDHCEPVYPLKSARVPLEIEDSREGLELLCYIRYVT